jgi:hypothetical protein
MEGLTMPPLALTDSQMTMLFEFARPLPPGDRDPFLQLVAHRLREYPTLGDGLVTRVGRETQAQFWVPPDLSRPSRQA